MIEGSIVPSIDGTIFITHKLSEKWKKGTCAVVAKEKCFFIEPDGTINESKDIPAGGIILVDPESDSDS